MTKDADSERMRKELLQDIRVELNKFEGRKEQEKRPDPFNFEGDGKSSRNGAKPKGQVEPNLNQDSRTEAPVEANGLQVQPSERERALEAQVKDLQQKVEMLLSQSEGAKGGNGDSGSENGNLAGRHGSSERYAGSESSGKYANRQGKTEATTRQSPSSHSSRQKELDRNVALGNEVNDRDRQKLERCGYYQQDDRNPGITDDRVMQRENRFSQGNERNGSWDRQRNRLDSYRTRDERAMRRSDGTFFVGNRQLQREREQEQYRMREPWRDDITHDTEADMGRNEYRDQRRSERMRNERWGNPYDGNQSDRSWRQQRGGYREADQRRSGENATRHWNRRPDESPRPFAGGEPQMVFSSDEFSEDERRWNRREQEPVRNVRRINEAEIRDADRRMEKWHVSFSGDARSRSLEDFLLKVRRLAKMDRIADDVLMQRIHTILRGEAYDWYLCYADEFNDWKQFEERIRYMYGNPNKDQGNRQKIYERKQSRNETFLSFKMEIERLNKLLSTPLDPQRIFEVIWDNMRPHYRSKLACKTVDSLRKLEYYAYRIDANDPVFRNAREGPSRANAVHNIEVDQKEDESYSSESESENVNAIGGKFDRDRRYRDQRTGGVSGRSQEAKNRESSGSSQLPLCWNCRKNGHLWRNCPEEKRLFCYLCGAQGKTVTTCENHAGDGRAQAKENSGN
ncbi:uncharacterized protein LOC134286900 [Aedes albopictus]|uniref:CCHC-type domain-containing protein n=1 Tax=Aedes albopictus TaxID=7160 RepID=A0ABM1ZUW9_AEDAL